MGIRQRVFAHKCHIIGSIIFGIAFIGTGLQHFIYLQFVKTLVPAYMPVQIFWAALTGAAMILAGISFIIRRYTNLAALLLSIMMVGFILLIHIPKLRSATHDINTWIRAVQDIAILGTALMLTAKKSLNKAGLYLYALPILLLGAAHFIHPGLIIPKIPRYFPIKMIFDFAVGGAMIVLAIFTLGKHYAKNAALALGILSLAMALLYSEPLLASNIKDGGEWTNLLLALATAAGGFVATGKVK